MAVRGKTAKPLLSLTETGTEPEFFITHIAKAEPAGNGNIRIYAAAERHDSLRLEFTFVTSVEGLAEMARAALQIAGDQHNLAIWKDDMTEQ